MKLQAVTVCINYADYLVCVVANRRHFDRWVIMTVAQDLETQELCLKYGLEARISTSIASDGSDFNAAYNKSGILNEGLDLLDQDGWALAIDADVHLPRDFRERLGALSLPLGSICGVAGRRVCGEIAMFRALADHEPWEPFCERHPTPYGFFQLFCLAQPNSRYLPSDGIRKRHADDDWFQLSFPSELHRTLPFTVLHVGQAYRNWHRRQSERFDEQQRFVKRCRVDSDMSRVFRGRVAVIGYFPGMPALRWFDQCAEVLLFDRYQIHQRSGDPLIEADRSVLRQVWLRETQELNNLRYAGTLSTGSLEAVSAASIDVIYLTGELVADWLVPCLPHLLRKLSPSGVISGDFYGLPHWPDSTYAISLLLGTPDYVSSDGFWSKRLTMAEKAISILPSYEVHPTRYIEKPQPQEGVVLVSRESSNLDALFITLHSMRRHWNGPAICYHWGSPDASVAIACARYSVQLLDVGTGFVSAHGGYDDLVWEATEVSPFARALFLPAGTLVVGDIAAAFRFDSELLEISALTPHLAIRENNIVSRSTVAHCCPGDSRDDILSKRLFVSDGMPDEWTTDAWEMWCENEVTMLTSMTCPAHIPEETMVITVVDPVTLPYFERNWLTWRFSANTPIWVILDGVAVSDVWYANNFLPDVVISIADLLSKGSINLPSKRVAVISPLAIPLPGARLSLPPECGLSAIAIHDIGKSRKIDPVSPEIPVDVDVVTSIEVPLFAILPAVCFVRALQSTGTNLCYLPSLSSRLRAVIWANTKSVEVFDMRRFGWRFSEFTSSALSVPRPN